MWLPRIDWSLIISELESAVTGPTTGSSEKPDFDEYPIKMDVDDIVNKKKKHELVFYGIVHQSGDS